RGRRARVRRAVRDPEDDDRRRVRSARGARRRGDRPRRGGADAADRVRRLRGGDLDRPTRPEAKMTLGALADTELADRFAALAIAAGDFRHREHIRLAFALLARHGDFADAAVEFRRLLRAFAAHHGVPERYHETITWAYLAIVHERMACRTCSSSLRAPRAT